MSFSQKFMAFLEKNELLHLLDDLGGKERWVYREEDYKTPSFTDVFGNVYINRAYDLERIKKEEEKKEKKKREKKTEQKKNKKTQSKKGKAK